MLVRPVNNFLDLFRAAGIDNRRRNQFFFIGGCHPIMRIGG